MKRGQNCYMAYKEQRRILFNKTLYLTLSALKPLLSYYVQQQTKQRNVMNGLRICRVTQCFPLIQSAALSGWLILVSSFRAASPNTNSN